MEFSVAAKKDGIYVLMDERLVSINRKRQVTKVC